MSSTETTRATLHELLSRLGRFEPEPVAALFADTVDWDVPGDERVPSTGARVTNGYSQVAGMHE